MPKTTLALRHLHIDRFYGRPHDGLRVDGLALGINVIHGPNGQGKTTLGRGLHALVWPALAGKPGPSLSGSFMLGDDEWRVDLDGAAVRHQRDGVEADAPPLADDDERGRYRLALHDLLHSDGADFARVVARDAAGGLDLDEATKKLRFSASTPNSGTATTAAKATWGDLDAERRTQKELEGEAITLDDLVAQQKTAAAAQALKEVWERAHDHAVGRDAAAVAAAALEALPSALAHTRDDDGDTLRALREAAREAAQRERDARNDAIAAEVVLAANVVSASGCPTPAAELRTLQDTLREADQALASRADELAGLRRQESEGAARLLPDADLDRAFAFALSDASAVGDYAKSVARLLGMRERAEALDRHEQELPEMQVREDLDAGAGLLRDWLRSEQSAPATVIPRHAIVGALVLTLFAVALGVLVHPAGFSLLLGAAALAALGLRLRTPADDRAAETQARFERLRLEPVSWTREGVETRLETVERDRAKYVLAEQGRTWVAARRQALGDVNAFSAQVLAQGRDLEASLGASIKAEGFELAFAVESVRVYQQARSQREAVEAAIAATTQRRGDTLAAAATLMEPFGLPPAPDLPALAGAIARLDEADRAAEAARTRLDAAHQKTADAERTSTETRTAIEALFQRLGLGTDGGDSAVDDACRQRAAYVAADRTAADARATAEAARLRLRAHPLFEDAHEAAQPEDAGACRDEAEALAGQAEALTTEVARLRERIGRAEAEHAVETAAAAHTAALGALRDERDRAAAARLGLLFANAAAHASQESQVPAVVRRAGEILGDITAHRYGLTFDPKANTFSAVDHVLGGGFVLDKLSSGTRVQLLLAVRVAFIEQRERGVCLPLVLDELLANSDEGRAEAITQAVVALCRAGRQVVYLTSQPEEVAKWRRIAEQHPDVACAFFALAGGSGEDDPDARPHASLAERVPAPGDRDHAAYGAALGVPHWTGHDDAGNLHLWYALADPHALHATLSAGVTRLGPACAAAASGAAAALGFDTAAHARLDLFADALAAWQAAWREGRGRPVRRDTLDVSGTITPTFLDRVADLAAELGGDGQALLDALREGRLARFRSGSTDDLEAYLVGHGFVDRTAPLDSDAVWERVVARVGAACDAEALREVRAFLGRVSASAPVGTDSQSGA